MLNMQTLVIKFSDSPPQPGLPGTRLARIAAAEVRSELVKNNCSVVVEPRPAASAGIGPHELSILVVDDEQMLTDLLSMALRMEGWDVRTAASGFEALQAVRDFEPDAMVLDIMMPDLDGMAVLHRLRQSGNDVPMLFLTAKDAVADRVRDDEVARVGAGLRARLGEGRDDGRVRVEEVVARHARLARDACVV